MPATPALILAFAVAAQPVFHLDNPADREAFRRWFTLLAESRFYAHALPEIGDCAALVRWSVRQSLVTHDTAWAHTLELPLLPALPAVRQTPRTPDLFQVASSQTAPSQTAQFADAATLRRFNAYFVTRNAAEALPGDLFFFRQFDRRMPAHVMIYVGPSQLAPSERRWVVYHTGPRGEIRKVELRDLMAHPAPEWRPLPGNTNFLGVYRLNLLRDTQ